MVTKFRWKLLRSRANYGLKLSGIAGDLDTGRF